MTQNHFCDVFKTEQDASQDKRMSSTFFGYCCNFGGMKTTVFSKRREDVCGDHVDVISHLSIVVISPFFEIISNNNIINL